MREKKNLLEHLASELHTFGRKASIMSNAKSRANSVVAAMLAVVRSEIKKTAKEVVRNELRSVIREEIELTVQRRTNGLGPDSDRDNQ